MHRLAGWLVLGLFLPGCSFLGLGGGSDKAEPEEVQEPAHHEDPAAKVDGRLGAIERNQDMLNKRTQQTEAALADVRSQMEGIRGQIALGKSDGSSIAPLSSQRIERREPEVDVDARAVELMTRLKKDGKRESVVTGVAQELSALGPDGVSRFVTAMRDRDFTTAQTIQGVLEQCTPKAACGPVQKGLADSTIRVRCIQILGELKDDSAVPDLVGYLDDPNPETKFYAADTLVRLEYKEAVPTLIDALGGTDDAKCAISFKTLSAVTGQTFGYRFFDSAEKREASAKLWAAWWKAEGKHFEFGIH